MHNEQQNLLTTFQSRIHHLHYHHADGTSSPVLQVQVVFEISDCFVESWH
jgi:hypothetical protein